MRKLFVGSGTGSPHSCNYYIPIDDSSFIFIMGCCVGGDPGVWSIKNRPFNPTATDCWQENLKEGQMPEESFQHILDIIRKTEQVNPILKQLQNDLHPVVFVKG